MGVSKLYNALAVCLIVNIICLCGCSSDSNEIAEIESSIKKNASSPSVGEQIVKVEQMIIEHIKRKGSKNRYVIKEIIPQEGADKNSVCLIASQIGGAMAKTDMPGDKIRLSFIGGVAYGEGSRWVPNIFHRTPSGIVTTGDLSGGDGSIHRYEGEVTVQSPFRRRQFF